MPRKLPAVTLDHACAVLREIVYAWDAEDNRRVIKAVEHARKLLRIPEPPERPRR